MTTTIVKNSLPRSISTKIELGSHRNPGEYKCIYSCIAIHSGNTTLYDCALTSLSLRPIERQRVTSQALCNHFRGAVTPKSVPPKIGPAGLILAGNLPKPVPRTNFAAKIGPAGPILAAKNGPLLPKSVPQGGPIMAKNYLPKSVPPQSGTLIPARTWLHGWNYYII